MYCSVYHISQTPTPTPPSPSQPRPPSPHPHPPIPNKTQNTHTFIRPPRLPRNPRIQRPSQHRHNPLDQRRRDPQVAPAVAAEVAVERRAAVGRGVAVGFGRAVGQGEVLFLVDGVADEVAAGGFFAVVAVAEHAVDGWSVGGDGVGDEAAETAAGLGGWWWWWWHFGGLLRELEKGGEVGNGREVLEVEKGLEVGFGG